MDAVNDSLSQLRDYEMTAVLAAVSANETAYDAAVARGLALMIFEEAPYIN